jgi:transposase-like protein
MRRFLQNLKNWGLVPTTVITDGSNLYPALLAELWPGADHQLCVFHILKEINGLILDAVRRLRTAMGRRGRAGRKRKPGRKGAKRRAAAARRSPTLKEKSAFVFRHRHLIVKRREKLDESERDDLARMLGYLPELATLRRFADRISWLFDAPKDYHQASCRRSVIVRDASFRAVPELVKALEQLSEEKFPKIMAYLHNPVSRRVRTNNHVERTNRMIRLLEKVRYKWRRRKTLVRFVVLRLDHIWSRAASRGGETRSHQAPRRRRRPDPTRQQPRQIA